MMQLEFIIDVSGSPGSNTYFALVSFNRITKDVIIDNFFNRYPEYKGKKGRELTKEDHLNIIKFLDESQVRMLIQKINANDWYYYISHFQNKPEHMERISGVLYYNLINTIARRNFRYYVLSCREKQLGNIERVFHHCDRLASKQKITIEYSYGNEKINRAIKIADFIAYGGRLINEKDIDNISKYKIIKRPPSWMFNLIHS